MNFYFSPIFQNMDGKLFNRYGQTSFANLYYTYIMSLGSGVRKISQTLDTGSNLGTDIYFYVFVGARQKISQNCG